MLAQFYPPIIGGAELHVQSLSAELARRGHQVSVGTLWHEGLPEFECHDDVRVHRVRGTAQRADRLFRDARKRPAMPLPDPGAVATLRALVARERPDVVHAHNWLLHSFVPLKPWSGARLAVTLHDFSLDCAKQTLIYRDGRNCSGPGLSKCLDCAGRHYGAAKGAITTLGNWTMGALERAAVDVFLPVSSDVAAGNRLAQRGLPFRVIPNFVPDDVDRHGDGVASYVDRLPSGDFLLFVGGFSRSKGVHVLLRAYERLGPGRPPLVLLGYPTPESPELLRDLPAGVMCFESWPHAAVMEAWRRSTLGVVPSVWREPCPTVVIEALAAGTPLIASRTGGIPDLIEDGVSGVLVPAGDADALAGAIGRALLDSEHRRRLRLDAPRRARQFQSSAVVPRIEAVYAALLRRGARAAAERATHAH